MSLHSTDGSSDSHHHSIMNQQNLIQLRVELFQFERTTIEVHLENYLEKIQRQYPSYVPEPFKMLQHHDILSFVLLGELSNAPAFAYQTLDVRLIQATNPSRVFFTATLVDQETQFPNATYTYHETPGISSALLKIDSEDGYLTTPPLGLMVQNQTIVSQFSVSMLLENISFSTTPFYTYTPVEIKKGLLYFPQQPNYHQGQNPVQQPTVYNHMPMFPNPPPPTLEPPRLVRNDLNTSVPWNSSQQSFVNQDRYKERADERADLLRNVKSRLARNDTNVEAPASTKDKTSAQQTLNASQSSNVQESSRPVIGDLNVVQQAQQAQDGLDSQQSSDHRQQFQPLMQMNLLNLHDPPNGSNGNGPPSTYVSFGDVPLNNQGAVGGTNVVQETQRDDMNQFLTFNIPSYSGDRLHQTMRMNNPGLHLYRNPDQEIQMTWDNYELNRRPDVYPQPLARRERYNQYSQSIPLAQSVPRYPQLNSLTNSPYNPYGPAPDKVSAIDQAKVVTPPSQLGDTQTANPVEKTVTPPVPAGSLGPPPPPAVKQPATGDILTTPPLKQIPLKMVQPATNVPLQTSGATPKIVSVPNPPLISDSSRITRASQDLVNAGKNLMKSKANKKGKNARSVSGD